MNPKSYLIPIIVIALFSLYPHVPAANIESEDDPLVKINILSKQTRLLSEGKVNQIALIIQKDTILSDELSSGQLKSNKIIFNFSDGRWFAQDESASDSEKKYIFNYKISGAKSDDICVIKLDSEERKYPLPFMAVCDSAGLRFYTWERLSKYAVDSACAEYESRNWKEREAIFALAHIIKARYHYAKKIPQHNDSDFCDLTHCQVYRGKSGSGIIFNEDWGIDYESLKHNLFFHSRCGGHTFNESIFSIQKEETGSGASTGVRDWLFSTGVRLCAGKDSSWSRSISADELAAIVFEKQKPENTSNLTIDRKDNRIIIGSRTNSQIISPETMRLKINRIKGWNFLKSNNYSFTEEIAKDIKIFHFTGEGLGHGVGLCQFGALTLSQMGYNRYEILEHYFQDISLKKQKNKTISYSPYLSYCVFNMLDGTVKNMNAGSGFLQRKIPSGSVFKLFVSMYLAKERQDIFSSYSFNCSGRIADVIMPDRCWKPEGHGNINIQEAIPNSCNLYFASLYNKIVFKDFKKFFKELCEKVSIHADLPEIKTTEQWSRLLAGLDYKISFSVKDYIRVLRYLNFTAENDSVFIPVEQRTIILKSLKDTFTKGTASGKLKPYGSPKNFDGLAEILKQKESQLHSEIWGKTATIIDGTNKPESYGLFIGGLGNIGIITLIRKGNGNLAARWAQVLLSNDYGD